MLRLPDLLMLWSLHAQMHQWLQAVMGAFQRADMNRSGTLSFGEARRTPRRDTPSWISDTCSHPAVCLQLHAILASLDLYLDQPPFHQ